MIEPTVGRIVWFHPGNDLAVTRVYGSAPFAAIITCVHDPRLINIAAFDAVGRTFPQTNVQLIQDDDPKIVGTSYCEWMPYQQAKAADEPPSELDTAKP